MILFDYLLLTTAFLLLIVTFTQSRFAKNQIFTSTFLLLIWLLMRTFITHHAPFSNVFETVVMFATLYLLKICFSDKSVRDSLLLKIPGVLLITTTFLFPESLRQPRELPAILDSFWFYIHVPSYFIGYVSLLFAFILSIIQVFNKNKDSKTITNELQLSAFFMTIGLLTGSAWANLSWSHFWGWDPKEIWALITWFLTLLTLHCNNKRLRLFCISIAFLSMLFTYFGVSFMFSGLHSYK